MDVAQKLKARIEMIRMKTGILHTALQIAEESLHVAEIAVDHLTEAEVRRSRASEQQNHDTDRPATSAQPY